MKLHFFLSLSYFEFFQEEGTDDKKVDIENKVPVKEETEEERYKRARKLYSERMQVIIKKRLNQDVWLTQQNSSPSTDTSTSSHSELKFKKKIFFFVGQRTFIDKFKIAKTHLLLF